MASKDISPWEAMAFVWQVLVCIAVPTTLFALAGRWIDTHYHLTPWTTLLGLIFAVATGLLLSLRYARRMAARMGEPTVELKKTT